jgi:hypothetical protein
MVTVYGDIFFIASMETSMKTSMKTSMVTGTTRVHLSALCGQLAFVVPVTFFYLVERNFRNGV